MSGIAIQNSCVACTARELYCNACCGLLPFGKWTTRLKSFRKYEQLSDDSPQATKEVNSLNTAYSIDDEEEMNQIGVVPWVSILIVCICPVVLTTLPFTILVTLDSFLIAFSLFL